MPPNPNRLLWVMIIRANPAMQTYEAYHKWFTAHVRCMVMLCVAGSQRMPISGPKQSVLHQILHHLTCKSLEPFEELIIAQLNARQNLGATISVTSTTNHSIKVRAMTRFIAVKLGCRLNLGSCNDRVLLANNRLQLTSKHSNIHIKTTCCKTDVCEAHIGKQ